MTASSSSFVPTSVPHLGHRVGIFKNLCMPWARTRIQASVLAARHWNPFHVLIMAPIWANGWLASHLACGADRVVGLASAVSAEREALGYTPRDAPGVRGKRWIGIAPKSYFDVASDSDSMDAAFGGILSYDSVTGGGDGGHTRENARLSSSQRAETRRHLDVFVCIDSLWEAISMCKALRRDTFSPTATMALALLQTEPSLQSGRPMGWKGTLAHLILEGSWLSDEEEISLDGHMSPRRQDAFHGDELSPETPHHHSCNGNSGRKRKKKKGPASGCWSARDCDALHRVCQQFPMFLRQGFSHRDAGTMPSVVDVRRYVWLSCVIHLDMIGRLRCQGVPSYNHKATLATGKEDNDTAKGTEADFDPIEEASQHCGLSRNSLINCLMREAHWIRHVLLQAGGHDGIDRVLNVNGDIILAPYVDFMWNDM